MNVIGRQMQRSGAPRQYSDNGSNNNNNYIEIPSKWLQPHNLPQDYRNLQRNKSAGDEFPLDPPSPLSSSRASSLRKSGNDGIFQNERSPGLLDLNAFDTQLIPELNGRSEHLDKVFQ